MIFIRFFLMFYVFLVFLITLLIFLPFFYIFYLFLPPQSSFFFYTTKTWAKVALPLTGIFTQRIDEGENNKDTNAIYIGNHSSYLDFFISASVFTPAKGFAEEAYKKIPIFGFIYKVNCILISRKSEKSRKKGRKKVEDNLRNKVSVLIYPEGKFNETDQMLLPFYDGAFSMAVNTGVPIRPVLFPDTRKRWNPSSFFSWTPGKCRALFLEEIPSKGKSPEELKNITYKVMEKRLKVLNQ